MKIILENICFYAYHGFFEEERRIGTNFTVTVTVEANLSEAEESDDLNDTINYQTIYDVVAVEMSKPSRLLEHLVRRILNAVKTLHTAINHVEVSLSKENPSLGGQLKKVTLVLSE